MAVTCIYITCITLCLVIPAIVFSTASFIIAGQNMNTTCDEGENSLLSLSTWLILNGSVTLSCVLVYFTFLVLFLIFDRYVFLVLFLILYFFNLAFIISWNIVGAIQLFSYSEECRTEAEGLWIITLVALILQWVAILQVCCLRNLLIITKNNLVYRKI